MGDNKKRSGADRRTTKERRSGTDTRSEKEKRVIGERRSQVIGDQVRIEELKLSTPAFHQAGRSCCSASSRNISARTLPE
jgi:hypothetical protein